MTEPLFVHLRNKISGVAISFTPTEAKQWLDHPVFGPNLEEVRTPKPEVLHSGKAEDKTSNKEEK